MCQILMWNNQLNVNIKHKSLFHYKIYKIINKYMIINMKRKKYIIAIDSQMSLLFILRIMRNQVIHDLKMLNSLKKIHMKAMIRSKSNWLDLSRDPCQDRPEWHCHDIIILKQFVLSRYVFFYACKEINL